MSFRRALLGFALCCAAPPWRWPSRRAQIEVSYEITFAGLTGFRIDFTAKFAGNRYDVQSHTSRKACCKRDDHALRRPQPGLGRLLAAGHAAHGGSLSLVVGGKPRTWLAQYGPGGLVKETLNPEWKPTPQQMIPTNKLHGSLDPLSAAISVGAAGDAACDRTVPSNDGKRRIDVILKKIGTESPQPPACRRPRATC